MVVGTSLYYDLQAPDGMILNGYTGRYELVNTLSNVKVEGDVPLNTEKTAFQIRLQTNTWKPGKYRFRVLSEDSFDGFIQVADEIDITLRP